MNKPAHPIAAESVIAPRYEQDVYGWAMAQGAMLRARRFDAIDWDNVAEEIETMGRSERRSLRSNITQIFVHMLKWDAQPERRGRSWYLSIMNHRRQAARDLDENPSLKPYMEDIAVDALEDARFEAAKETGIDKSVFDRLDFAADDAFNRVYAPPEGD